MYGERGTRGAYACWVARVAPVGQPAQVLQGHRCRVGWDANHAELDPGRAQGSELVVGYGMFGKVLERFWTGFGKVCYGKISLICWI